MTYEGMSGGGRAPPGLPEGTGGIPPPGRLGIAGAGLPPGGTPGGARPAAAAGAGGGCDLFIAGEGGENLQSEDLSVPFDNFLRDSCDCIFEYGACIYFHQIRVKSEMLKISSATFDKFGKHLKGTI
jgi:hypothetical protein